MMRVARSRHHRPLPASSPAKLVAALAPLALFAACASPPPPAPEPRPPVAVEAKPPEPKGPPPGSPAAKQQAQQLARSASEALNEGDEERARAELQQARELDPENRTVACLQKGLTADPQATLGRDSSAYIVRPGETMGRIAQRALGDVCEFYLLARYNNIKVPKQLAAGQTIRVPGKTTLAPPPEAAAASSRRNAPLPEPVAAPAPPEPPRSESAPATEPAAPAPVAAPTPAASPPATAVVPPMVTPTVSAPSRSGAAIDAAATKTAIETHMRAAQAAFRRQDLATAIREWDLVLSLDPANDFARAKRQEAIELDRRAKQLK
jgi:LysM repeat protein